MVSHILLRRLNTYFAGIDFMSVDISDDAMESWELVDKAQIPGQGGELLLYRRDSEYSISIAGSRWP